MSRTVKRICLAAITVLYFLLVISLARVFDVAQALREYLRPTTVEGNFLPQGCVITNETPPPDLMEIVKGQKKFYNLALQKVTVCRSARALPEFEVRYPGLTFGEELRNQWRPLGQGCCSCQFGRHIIVMAAQPSENGSVLVQANLIQSRWDYLRLKCNQIKWVWIKVGLAFFVFISLLFFSGLWLAKAIHRALRGSTWLRDG